MWKPKLLIDGALVDGESTREIVNPATGASFISAPCASPGQMELAIAAAREAQPAWAAKSAAERGSALRELARRIGERNEEFARLLVQEQGKPLAAALGEVAGAQAFIEHFTTVDIPIEVVQQDENYRIEIRHRPLGVAAAIVAWNYPLLMASYKLACALMTGNALILKPAPTTPLTSLLMGELAADIFPAGVLSVLSDDNDIGPMLAKHPAISKITFTGSTATGRKIALDGANSLKRLTLELGGNDAAIVLPDADLDEAAKAIAEAAFINSGQICIAVKRAYVHDEIYDAFCGKLAEVASGMVVGDGFEQGVTHGPIQNAMQFEKAKGYLKIAHEDGHVIAGGKTFGGGYFMQPTVVRDILDSSVLVQEEQFAPILPVVSFEDTDDVIARVNACEYGLGGSVWSKDEDKAFDLACRVESGTVWVNHHGHIQPNIPFGGAKQSGIGVEWGVEGMLEFTQQTVINVAHRKSAAGAETAAATSMSHAD